MLIQCLEKIAHCYASWMPRAKPSPGCLEKACIIAHRGAHDNKMLIENTLDAFQKALELDCWGVELDVHATADNILVVNHDPTLKRLWGKKQNIAALTFSELRALVPAIPTLSEVVSLVGKKIHLFIELKAPFYQEKALAEALKYLEPKTHYHLLALNESVFDSFSTLSKSCCLLVASAHNARRFCHLSLQKNYAGVLGHFLLLNNALIKTLKAHHQQVGVGIVNSTNNAYRELNRGIHWIFTDQPTVLKNRL